MAVETLGSVSRARVPPWNDPVIRGWVFQIVVVGAVGFLAWYLVSNTVEKSDPHRATQSIISPTSVFATTLSKECCRKCPLWVKSGHGDNSAGCSFYLR